MSAHADRVLEYALQLHYGRVAMPDLGAEIVRAWERGVRGTGLDDLPPSDLQFEPLGELERDVRSARARRVPWLALAAALLLVVGALGWRTWRGGHERTSPDVDPPVASTLPSADEVATVEALFERMTDFDLRSARVPGQMERMRRESREAAAVLAKELAAEPRYWDIVELRTLELVEGPDVDPWAVGAALDLLAYTRTPRALELARELWTRAPDAFAIDHLVAFAESGADELERELAAVIEDGSAFPGESRVLAAAYFALRGDDRGRDVLLAGLEEPVMSRDGVPLPLVAAFVLEDLGEAGAWTGALAGLELELELWFRLGRDDVALDVLVAAELFDGLRAKRERPKLCELGARLEAELAARKPALASRDALRAALRQLTQR